MTMSNTLETSLLQLLMNATDFANIADNATTGPATSLWLSLHTGDPGDAGDQGTSESAYTSYARQSVARTSTGWSVSAGVASLVAAVSFPAATGTGATITYLGVGLSSGATSGILLLSGAVSPNISISNGVTPQITTGTTVTFD